MHIYSSDLKYVNVALPSLPEQAAIVRFLDHIDQRIRRYIRGKQKLVGLLKEECAIATLEAIQGTSRNQRLGTVAELLWRPVNRRSDRKYTPLGLYNRGRGIFKKETRSGDDLGDSDFSWIEEGDLVVSGQFAWEGAIALASASEKGCVASHRYPILRGKPGILETEFLFAFLQTDWGQLLLNHHSRGAAGRNRPLNPKTLMKENISVPALESQVRVAKRLEHEAAAGGQIARLTEELSEYRTRLITDVVTGKLDVRDAAERLPDPRALATEEDPDGDLHRHPITESSGNTEEGLLCRS